LEKYLTDYDRNNIDIKKALMATKPLFRALDHCGFMDAKRINLFLNWLVEKQLEDKMIKGQTLFTNELLT
jgi:hypothetical protein